MTMAIVNTRSDAIPVLRGNFEAAQQAGRISFKTQFNPKLVKEVSVRTNQGATARCHLIYTTRSGRRNRRVNVTHDYPSLVTN
jgi:hypothetical protein